MGEVRIKLKEHRGRGVDLQVNMSEVWFTLSRSLVDQEIEKGASTEAGKHKLIIGGRIATVHRKRM